MKFFFMMIVLIHSAQSWGEDKVQEKPLPPELQKSLGEMKKGKMERKKVLKIAEGILKHGDSEKASELYAEYSKDGDEDEVVFNRATSLLKQGKVDEAMPFVQDLLKNSRDESVKDKMRNNLLLAIKKDKNDQNQKNDKQKEDDKKDDKKDGKEGDKDDQKNKDDKNKKDQKDNKNGKDDQKNEQDKKDGKNQEQKKKEEKSNKDQDKENEKKDPQDLKKPEEKAPQTLEEKEKKIELQRKMVKTPAMVKQIMNDDRELQRMMMDTSTNERGQSKPKRDW